ncbi:MAG: hypothetical protein R3C12_18315 [Planctomycetaceae bacterium]
MRKSLLLFVCILLLPTCTIADDWPQWMGPRRDNVWRESGILKKFPRMAPRFCGGRKSPVGMRGLPSPKAECT